MSQIDSSYADQFFDLANSPTVSYRMKATSDLLSVDQDNNLGETTGGIVWETSYFLGRYFEEKIARDEIDLSSSKVLEVGAGCGLLGLILNRLKAKEVVLTELDDSSGVLNLLRKNVSQNSGEGLVRACALDWSKAKDSTLFSEGANSFDLIVGTDVVFRKDLVAPLLKICCHLSKKKTGKVVFCLQERCADALAELISLGEGAEYFCDYEEITDTVDVTFNQGEKYGLRELDIRVFRFAKPKEVSFDVSGEKRKNDDLDNNDAVSKKMKT